MRFAICNEIYKGWSLPDTFRHARLAGYDAVEIAPFTIAKDVRLIDAARRAEIRREAAAAGVAISAIHWVLVETEGLHVTSPDPVVRARTARYFVDLVDFGADLGAPAMVVGSPRQRNLLPGVSPTKAGHGPTTCSGPPWPVPATGPSPFASSRSRRPRPTSSTPPATPAGSPTCSRRPP